MSVFRLYTAELEHIPIIQKIVEPAWWAVYGPILTDEQVAYMLSEFYNHNALVDLINSGDQEFVILNDNGNDVGFAAFSKRKEESNVFKLNKLYLYPELKGKGYGKLLMDEVIARIDQKGGKTLDLNVNRYNESKGFYERMGFEVIYEEDIPVGKFFMNDYVMRKTW